MREAAEKPAQVLSLSVMRTLAIAGLLGGLLWTALAFLPGAETRSDEVFKNRLWTPALLGMLIGYSGLILLRYSSLTRIGKGFSIALLVGLGLMVLGNFAEYWIFSDYPHEGPNGFIRGIAWMTFLSGALVAMLSSAIVGFTWLKHRRRPSWLGVLLLLLLPSTVAIGFVSMHWAGTPIGLASIAVGLQGLRENPGAT